MRDNLFPLPLGNKSAGRHFFSNAAERLWRNTNKSSDMILWDPLLQFFEGMKENFITLLRGIRVCRNDTADDHR